MQRKCQRMERNFPGGVLRCMKVDFRRSVLSWRFVLTTAAILGWMLLNCWDDLTQRLSAYSVAGYLSIGCAGAGNFAMLILVIATFPFAWSYCEDKEAGFFSLAEIRVGRSAYSVSKAIWAAASSFLAAQIALFLFYGILLAMGVTVRTEISDGVGPYTELATTQGMLAFYIVRSSLTALTCGAASEFGLMATAFLPNRYYSSIAPMFGYFCVDMLQTITSQMFSLDYGIFWINGIFFGRPMRSVAASACWSAGMMLLCIAVCGQIFYNKVQRSA